MQAYVKTIENNNAPTENEQFLMASFRDGGQDAFRLVYERMSRSLFYFVQNIIDSTSHSEDIVAEAFTKLYGVRTSMQSFEHIKRWLFVIARNLAIDHLREKAKDREATRHFSLHEDEEEY